MPGSGYNPNSYPGSTQKVVTIQFRFRGGTKFGIKYKEVFNDTNTKSIRYPIEIDENGDQNLQRAYNEVLPIYEPEKVILQSFNERQLDRVKLIELCEFSQIEEIPYKLHIHSPDIKKTSGTEVVIGDYIFLLSQIPSDFYAA